MFGFDHGFDSWKKQPGTVVPLATDKPVARAAMSSGRRLREVGGIAPRLGVGEPGSGSLRSGRNRVGPAAVRGAARGGVLGHGRALLPGTGTGTGSASGVARPVVEPLRPLGRAQTARVNARQSQALAQARAADHARQPGQRAREPTAPTVSRRQSHLTPRRRTEQAAARSRENVELHRALDTVVDTELSPRARVAVAAAAAAASSAAASPARVPPGQKRKPDSAQIDKQAKRQGLEQLSPGDLSSSSPVQQVMSSSVVSADSDCCPVCLCEMEQGEHAIFITSCGHRYHFKCLRSCLLNKTTNCPVCRREFTSMTPPLQRPRPKGRSIASLVERNVVIVCSGAPILEHTYHEGTTINGLMSIDELGRVLPIPPDGFSGEDMRHVQVGVD